MTAVDSCNSKLTSTFDSWIKGGYSLFYGTRTPVAGRRKTTSWDEAGYGELALWKQMGGGSSTCVGLDSSRYRVRGARYLRVKEMYTLAISF